MRSKHRLYQNQPQLVKKLIAVAFLLCFLAVVLLIPIWISNHADHVCAVEACSVCLQIIQKQTAMEFLQNAVAVSFFMSAALLFFVIVCLQIGWWCDYPISLVKIKVRMNN